MRRAIPLLACLILTLALAKVSLAAVPVFAPSEDVPVESMASSNQSARRDASHFIMTGYQASSFRSDDCDIKIPGHPNPFTYVLITGVSCFNPLFSCTIPRFLHRRQRIKAQNPHSDPEGSIFRAG